MKNVNLPSQTYNLLISIVTLNHIMYEKPFYQAKQIPIVSHACIHNIHESNWVANINVHEFSKSPKTEHCVPSSIILNLSSFTFYILFDPTVDITVVHVTSNLHNRHNICFW